MGAEEEVGGGGWKRREGDEGEKVEKARREMEKGNFRGQWGGGIEEGMKEEEREDGLEEGDKRKGEEDKKRRCREGEGEEVEEEEVDKEEEGGEVKDGRRKRSTGGLKGPEDLLLILLFLLLPPHLPFLLLPWTTADEGKQTWQQVCGGRSRLLSVWSGLHSRGLRRNLSGFEPDPEP